MIGAVGWLVLGLFRLSCDVCCYGDPRGSLTLTMMQRKIKKRDKSLQKVEGSFLNHSLIQIVNNHIEH